MAVTDREPLPCPLCGAGGTTLFHTGRDRIYLRCPACSLVFVPPRFHPDETSEKHEYDLHRNDSDDPGYRKFLSRLADPLLETLAPGAAGLDFGCGPAPALAAIMEENGHPMDLFDPLYRNTPECLDKQYDFICASEAVEHFNHPGREFERLFRMLRPGGWLAIMTKMVSDPGAFAAWHYIRDITHVCFYSRATFNHLAETYGYIPEFRGKDVVLLQKK